MYDLGDVASVTFYTADANGNPANAGSLPTITVTQPDLTTLAGGSITVTNPATGTYTVTFTTAQIGLYGFRAVWSGGTAVAGSYVDSLDVEDPAYFPAISLAEAKSHLNLTGTVAYDEKLRTFIDQATNLAEDHCNRAIAQRTYVQVASGGKTFINLWKVQVISITSVVENGVTLAPTDFTCQKMSGVLLRGTYAFTVPWVIGVDNVTITYVAGFPSPPPALRLGVKEILRWLWANTQDSPRPSARKQGANELLTDALPKWLFRPLDKYKMAGIG